jgi:hypothetical protein
MRAFISLGEGQRFTHHLIFTCTRTLFAAALAYHGMAYVSRLILAKCLGISGCTADSEGIQISGHISYLLRRVGL